MKTAKNTVKSRLEDLLETSSMTEYDLAKASGVEYTTIHRIMTGETEKPSRNTLSPIANALNTTVEYLRNGTGKKDSESEKSILSRAMDKLEDQLEKKDKTIEALTKVLMAVTGGKDFLQLINRKTALGSGRLAPTGS